MGIPNVSSVLNVCVLGRLVLSWPTTVMNSSVMINTCSGDLQVCMTYNLQSKGSLRNLDSDVDRSFDGSINETASLFLSF